MKNKKRVNSLFLSLILSLSLGLILMAFAIPLISAVSTGTGTNPNMNTEEFGPRVWMCDSRAVIDDNTEPGRFDGPNVNYLNLQTCETSLEICATACIQNATSVVLDLINQTITFNVTLENRTPLLCNTLCISLINKTTCNVSKGNELLERINNYAFEGEKIEWLVLVMDKNGIDKVQDVFATVGDSQGGGVKPIIMKVNRTVNYCDSTGRLFVPWSQNLVIPKFNSSLGQLVKVTVNGSAFIEINATFENVDPTNSANFTIVYSGGNISVNFPEQNLIFINSGFNVNGTVGPYDNITDFNGTSGISFYFINSTLINFQGNNFSLYESNSGGNLIIPASSFGSAEISGLANFDGGIRTMSGADVCVSYTYQVEEVVLSGNTGIEANCARLNGFSAPGESIRTSCNARIDEERITQYDPNTMSYYECTLTVETPESMYGEHWINAVAEDIDGNTGMMDENEYWFLNPVVAISIDGEMTFDNVRPGTDSYSSTLLVGNDADSGSGVLMDMFISGTDFYDSTSSGAKCPLTNQLSLSAFRYFATNGAYSTYGDDEIDLPAAGNVRDVDTEGYVNIDYGIGFNNPNPFYDNMEILQDQHIGVAPAGYYTANILAPGAEMAITFKLSLPEPCNGDFDSGSIYFWGEAI